MIFLHAIHEYMMLVDINILPHLGVMCVVDHSGLVTNWLVEFDAWRLPKYVICRIGVLECKIFRDSPYEVMAVA